VRDFIVMAIILGSIPVALFNPFVGVLVWYWIAYFNPHRLAWGISNYPVAQMIAIPTIVGMIFSRQWNKRIFERETVLMLVLWIWFGITYIHALQIPLFSGHIQDARTMYINVTKILLMTIVTMLIVNTQQKLRVLLLVVGLSFGVLAIKTAIFGLLHGGERVWGPDNSFIGDNNAFGLAMDMNIPIFYFIASCEKSRLLRIFLWMSLVSALVCVILSYSRGALLGLAVVLLGVTLRSRRKLVIFAVIGIAGLSLFAYAPEQWRARMDQFFSGHLDSSAQERLITWRTGLNLALDYPVFGGGFQVLPDVPVYQKYMPRPLPNGHMSSGPHSIYIQELSEHGFVGLALFLSLIASCLASLIQLRRYAQRTDDHNWLIAYSHMFELSIIAFMIGGAFLEFANFDFWYLVIGCIVIMKVICRSGIREQASHSYRAEQPQVPAYNGADLSS
jgi:putative inorganic carbon (HCO3(-)) transporter